VATGYRMRKLLVFLLYCSLTTTVIASETLEICTDKNFWYPFTYVKGGKSVGLQLDIISKAASNLDISLNYTALPWKRCLREAEAGRFDGIAVASYKPKRAESMHFPDDAETSKKSTQRVMQVEYVVVTAASVSYEFDGNLSTIPTPVRVPRGYSIADDLRKKGVEVDDSAQGDENNVKKMLRAGEGSIVTLPTIVEVLGGKPAFKGKLKVSKVPLKSKSYYLTFSKKGKASEAVRTKLWEEIVKIREDVMFMEKMSSKY